jgi:hypothetical protein
MTLKDKWVSENVCYGRYFWLYNCRSWKYMREALTSFKNVYNMSDNKINPAFLIKAFDDRN